MNASAVLGICGLLIISVFIIVGIRFVLKSMIMVGLIMLLFPCVYIASFFIVTTIETGKQDHGRYDNRVFPYAILQHIYRPMKFYDHFIYGRMNGGGVVVWVTK